jgi:hypothetical protein
MISKPCKNVPHCAADYIGVIYLFTAARFKWLLWCADCVYYMQLSTARSISVMRTKFYILDVNFTTAVFVHRDALRFISSSYHAVIPSSQQ